MATLEARFLDLLNPIDLVDHGTLQAQANYGNSSSNKLHTLQLHSPALPAWMETRAPAATAAQWDWFEAEPSLAGLEVTEHSVPAGWFERTFGIAGSGTALAA